MCSELWERTGELGLSVAIPQGFSEEGGFKPKSEGGAVFGQMKS